MFIAIEIGNTTAKFGLFGQTSKPEYHSLLARDSKAIVALLEAWQSEGQHTMYGVASGDTSALVSFPIRWLDASYPWPFSMAYKTPQTLGIDRLLVTAAAYLQYGDRLLVVSAGTCITYNLVVENAFLGGAISPGWDMRYAAMHHFTHALPRVQRATQSRLLGTDTQGSLLAGVDRALPLEVEAMIAAYVEQYQLKTVVVCGGDAPALEEHIKKYIFAPSNYELLALQQLYANENEKSQ